MNVAIARASWHRIQQEACTFGSCRSTARLTNHAFGIPLLLIEVLHRRDAAAGTLSADDILDLRLQAVAAFLFVFGFPCRAVPVAGSVRGFIVRFPGNTRGAGCGGWGLQSG